MANTIFSIQIKGNLVDDKYLRLPDLINQLEAIKGVLTYLDYSVTQSRQLSTYYRIVDLNHAHPATIVLEAMPLYRNNDYSSMIVSSLFISLQQILSGYVPADYDYSMLQAFKKIGDKNITEFHLSRDNEKIEVPSNLAAEVENILGFDEVIESSVNGTLELLNINKNNNWFNLYPVLGAKKITCHFSPNSLPKAIAADGHYVNVAGQCKYKSRYPYPYHINATEIEVYPDENDLPTLSELRGIAPDATGNLSSEDFVRGIRDEW